MKYFIQIIVVISTFVVGLPFFIAFYIMNYFGWRWGFNIIYKLSNSMSKVLRAKEY